MNPRGPSLLLLALGLVAGCKLPPDPSNPVSVAGGGVTQGPGGFLQMQSSTGITLTSNFSTVFVKIATAPEASITQGGTTQVTEPGRLPSFASAIVTVHSPTKLTEARLAELKASEFDNNGLSQVAAISKLPLLTDATVRLYLRDAAGRLIAAGQTEAMEIKRGRNDVAIQVKANTVQAELLGASDNINVSDKVIVKGAQLDLTTGVADDTQGVARVDVEISGLAYAGGKEQAVVASLKAPRLNSYAWQPSKQANNYTPTKLAESTDKQPLTLTSKAIDPFGNVVGRQAIALEVVGTAFFDVGVDLKESGRTPAPTSVDVVPGTTPVAGPTATPAPAPTPTPTPPPAP